MQIDIYRSGAEYADIIISGIDIDARAMCVPTSRSGFSRECLRFAAKAAPALN